MPRPKKTPPPSTAIVVTDDFTIDPFDDRVLPADLVKARRLREVLDLHKAGATYDAIAEKLDIGPKAVKLLVREAVKMLTAEIGESTIDEHRAIALAQLNDMYVVASNERDIYLKEVRAWHEGQAGGKVPAPELLIDIQEHMRHIHGDKVKLLGLNAATKIEAAGIIVDFEDLQKHMSAMDANEAPPEMDENGNPWSPPTK